MKGVVWKDTWHVKCAKKGTSNSSNPNKAKFLTREEMAPYLDGSRTYTFEPQITCGTMASLDLGLRKEKSKKNKIQSTQV
jgi:hypothetical protein